MWLLLIPASLSDKGRGQIIVRVSVYIWAMNYLSLPKTKFGKLANCAQSLQRVGSVNIEITDYLSQRMKRSTYQQS